MYTFLNKLFVSNSDFHHLLASNADFLKPVAITLTRDPETAADLFQETIYKALANREKYNVGTNIRAWLYTIMRNVFINDYRRTVRQKQVLDSFLDEGFIHRLKATVANEAESLLEVKYIQKCIRNLPEMFRSPLTLYFDGYRYYEIARMLNEPLGTIKSRIHFARKLLKSQLPDRFPGNILRSLKND